MSQLLTVQVQVYLLRHDLQPGPSTRCSSLQRYHLIVDVSIRISFFKSRGCRISIKKKSLEYKMDTKSNYYLLNKNNLHLIPCVQVLEYHKPLFISWVTWTVSLDEVPWCFILVFSGSHLFVHLFLIWFMKPLQAGVILALVLWCVRASYSGEELYAETGSAQQDTTDVGAADCSHQRLW